MSLDGDAGLDGVLFYEVAKTLVGSMGTKSWRDGCMVTLWLDESINQKGSRLKVSCQTFEKGSWTSHSPMAS